MYKAIPLSAWYPDKCLTSHHKDYYLGNTLNPPTISISGQWHQHLCNTSKCKPYNKLPVYIQGCNQTNLDTEHHTCNISMHIASMHCWKNGTRCKGGANVSWCSCLVWVLFGDTISTCACFHIHLFMWILHCNFINRILICMDLMLQTSKVLRMPSFLERNWSYLNRFLLIQDALENYWPQAMGIKLGHFLTRGMCYIRYVYTHRWDGTDHIVLYLLYTLRNAVYVFLPFFTHEKNFSKFVVIKLREWYEVWFTQKTRGYLNFLSSDGTRLGAVKDVSW